MKKVEANRYPHSATLFKFCKEALEIRYEGNVKVIDQDVGAILGYDPADCSHWKKGKKNIRALGTLKSIADHLSIDERLLIDIASGRIGLEEAVFEFRGYGAFALSGKSLESLKKEFFRNPQKWQSTGDLRNFEDLFDINRSAIVQIAEAIVRKGEFQEAPIYIPEVIQIIPNLSIESIAEGDTPVKVIEETSETGALQIKLQYRGQEMRPYIRFLLAKEILKQMVRLDHPLIAGIKEHPAEVIDIQANIFAGMLLVPGILLKKEVEKIDSSLDLVAQLADTFWVSKALMNQRLRDYLENFN